MHPVAFIFRYGELGLKGSQRSYFEFILRNNIETALKELGVPKESFAIRFVQKRGQILMSTDNSVKYKDKILKVLKNTPGIVWVGDTVASVNLLDLDKQDLVQSIINAIFNVFKEHGYPAKVEVKRYNKTLTFTSQQIFFELNKKLRQVVKNEKKNPSLSALIIFEDNSLKVIYKLRGIGGLPVSSTAKGVILFSGGIDSPVASFMAFKRGIRADLLHFSPELDNIKESKIFKQYKVLKQYNPYLKLYVTTMPSFSKAMHNQEIYNPIVYFRRLIIRVAIKLLIKEYKRGAIITGDSLGQVASQTISNLIAQNNVLVEDNFASRAIILRPLIGLDKEEIIEISKRIGTYELSIQEYKDCCSLMNKGSKTQTDLLKMLESEDKQKSELFVNEALDNLILVQ